MADQSVTLPFTVPNLFAGFAQGKGLAKASPSELVLEFVLKHALTANEEGRMRPLSLLDLSCNL
jgi:hypothetical protein